MEASGGGALVLENPDSPCRPEDYVEVAGYRLVKPYHFDFCLSVRQRWIGQSIIDIFTREFPARDRAYYLQALADGVLRVEGCQVGPDTPLKDGHRMRHYIHRHEPPVPAGPIAVVGTSEAAVAVCKPAGMPVHVAGQYRKNTVLGVLQAERPDLGPLFPVHRLDKPVSGLLLFARSAAAAAALCRQIESRDVDKVYVARVLGRFSEGHMVADVPLAWDTVANHALAVPEAAVEAAAAEATADDATMQGVLQAEQQETEQQQEQQPAQQAGQQQGEAQQEVSMAEQRRQRKQQQKAAKLAAKGAKADRQAALRAAAAATTARGGKSTPKPALTEFRLLAVAEDGLTSIVECRPRTGRTHQIRVHLQHLGHPIANDTQYGGTYGGPLASRHMAQTLGVHWASQAAGAGGSGAAGGSAGGCCSSKRPRLEGKAEGEGVLPQEQQQQQVPPQVPPPPPQQQQQRQQHQQSGEEQAAAEPAGGGDADAYAQCRAFRCRPEFEAEAGLRDALCSHCPYYAPRDYPLDLRPLWLHARRYSCGEGSWSFSAPPPEWAHPDWLPPAPYDQQWHAAAAAAACGGGGGKLFPERL